MSPVRICLVASNRNPICAPFAGGLESFTHGLATRLVRGGHEVTLFAGPGSDPGLPVRTLDVAAFVPSAAAMADRNAPAEQWLRDHHAYLALMLELAGSDAFDVVHNTSLHHLPVAMARALPVPLLTTLHTPPLPWIESAFALARGASSFVAVSAFTARSWAHALPSTPILNGVDTAGCWRAGPGGDSGVWSGRLVPEKAPHEAIDACRAAGVPLRLAGPVSDPAYFRAEVAPRLGGGVEHVGHLGDRELAALVGSSGVALVTPAWDEPYGLVAAEAMACGTPVVAYARGALPEVVGREGGVLVPPGDVSALAGAVATAQRLDRGRVRRHAERTCSVDRMVTEYVAAYHRLLESGVAA